MLVIWDEKKFLFKGKHLFWFLDVHLTGRVVSDSQRKTQKKKLWFQNLLATLV